MTPEQRQRLERFVKDFRIPMAATTDAARAAMAEIDRLTAERDKWKHLYESQHMPRHDGFKPTEAP